ncbi:MAG: thiol-disulfide oxidoreductase DCC family protein [Oceanicaulis sp.]
MQKTTESSDLTARECSATVYYDGSCPLCRAEIGLYRDQGSEAAFVDISDGEGGPEEISCDAAMKRFHVRRADGKLLSGAAAFAELWKTTPGWRRLGHVGSVPPFVWIGEALYRAFLLIRPSVQKMVRKKAG